MSQNGEDSSASDVKPSSKKMCAVNSSTRCRFSVGQSDKAQKRWAVFDFTSERPGSLMTVPASWVKAVKKPAEYGNSSRNVKSTCCFWPRRGSADEKSIHRLIQHCSEPDHKNWLPLSGVLKGFFKSIKEADAFIAEKLGTQSTDTEMERLAALSKKAAQHIKDQKACVRASSILKSATGSTGKYIKSGTTPSNTAISPKMINTPTPVTNTQTSCITSPDAMQATDAVGETLPAQADEMGAVGVSVSSAISLQSGAQARDAVGEALPAQADEMGAVGGNLSSTISPQNGQATARSTARCPTHASDKQAIIATHKPNDLPAVNMTLKDKSHKDHVCVHQEQCIISDILLILRDIKEQLQRVEEKVDGSKRLSPASEDSDSAYIDNPFDVLISLGFKAKTLEELIKREQLFAETHTDYKKNRNALLKTLLQLVPKPGKKANMTPVDVVRANMQCLADDAVWQYISALGRSGTKNIAMCQRMPLIMNIVVLIAIKILDIDRKQAITALCTYLKNTATRAAAKKHRAEFGTEGSTSLPADRQFVGANDPTNNYDSDPTVAMAGSVGREHDTAIFSGDEEISSATSSDELESIDEDDLCKSDSDF